MPLNRLLDLRKGVRVGGKVEKFGVGERLDWTHTPHDWYRSRPRLGDGKPFVWLGSIWARRGLCKAIVTRGPTSMSNVGESHVMYVCTAFHVESYLHNYLELTDFTVLDASSE
jgi:hypothetical protein